MKQFLYLDTDIVNSIVAQSQKGLVTQTTVEKEDNTTKNSGNTEKISATGSGNIGSFWKFVEFSSNLSGSAELSHSSEVQSVSKDVINKILHDSAFDIAYKCISPKVIFQNKKNYDEEGNYVEIKRYYDFVDLDYLEGLFTKGGLIDFIKKVDKESFEKKLNQAKEGLNREQIRQSSNNLKKEVNKFIEKNNKQYDDIAAIIKAIRSFMPYNRLLISKDGYLIPLDEQYFRVDPKNLGFRYGGEITCVGIITNIFGEDANPNDSQNVFATLQYAANSALKELLPTTEKNICIVHPIAVYYGE